jgi:hypothetical protein
MSKEYDKIFKENFEAIYLRLSEKILKFKPLKVENVKLDLQRTIERQPDFLKKVKHPETGKTFLLHIEVQTTDNNEMVYRMIEYYGLILRSFKFDIRQMVIYIGEGESKMQNFLEDGPNRFEYELYSIQRSSYHSFLKSESPEELLLAILGNLENDSPTTVLKKIINRAKDVVHETFSMEKFVVQLEAFAKFRNYIEPFKLVYQKMFPFEIKPQDTFLYKMGQESGIKDGEKRGERRGEKRGKKNKQDEMILAFLKIGKLPIEDIAKAAGVSVAYVNRLKKKAGI